MDELFAKGSLVEFLREQARRRPVALTERTRMASFSRSVDDLVSYFVVHKLTASGS
jgi:hypothetical protein